jgi:hypothetical protein
LVVVVSSFNGEVAMKEQTHEDPKILAAAERQMQAWTKNQEIADRRPRVDQGHRLRPLLGDYITISREAGAGGGEVAALVGRTLGWEVLDKNLLDRVADMYRLPRPMLEFVDETSSNWAYDLLGPWLDPAVISHEKYLARLARVVLKAARLGNVVIVGRGGRFLLPRDQGLAVRIVASEKYRIAQIMLHDQIGEAAARRRMTEIDHGRREFVAHSFRRDISDPHLYDLVINTEHLGTAVAASTIITAYGRPGGRSLRQELVGK